jgi:hypothetical protein
MRRVFRANPLQPKTRLNLLSLEDRAVPAVIVTLDYSLDSTGFFSGANEGRRAILQTAVDAVASQLGDSLTAINPTGSDTWTPQAINPATGTSINLPTFSVGQNEIRVYVGARALAGSESGEGATGGAATINGSQSWIDTVISRGQGVTTGNNASDYGPWGGSIAFDTSTNWFFGTNGSGLGSTQLDFFSVAQHEFLHVLGFGTADSWSRLSTGANFAGGVAAASFGSPVPLSADRAHWAQNVVSDGRQAIMTPVIGLGQFLPVTSLDFAGLDDIGWTIGSSPTPPTVTPPPATPLSRKIIVTGVENGPSHVQVFNLDGSLRLSFFAYGTAFVGGVRVAAGDVTGDGYEDIITGSGPGGAPRKNKERKEN